MPDVFYRVLNKDDDDDDDGLHSMKRLRVFLLPPGWDASRSQGYPQH